MPPKKRLTPEIDTGQITPRCACSVPPLRPAPAGLFSTSIREHPPLRPTEHDCRVPGCCRMQVNHGEHPDVDIPRAPQPRGFQQRPTRLGLRQRPALGPAGPGARRRRAGG
ncbi:hypothetical protein AOA76_01270 [Pseudomonas aeruginosa]|nr:hypothetical protein AOA76_01270 [Pseudomonas aeruginosa]RPS63952.1 hypothetical protein IPC991_22785 [Pseudomonas aeruginosa]RPT65252.1 hypothetical protein IPC971_03420 [Pseudomonas aeruginosa]